jgi:predicted esterase
MSGAWRGLVVVSICVACVDEAPDGGEEAGTLGVDDSGSSGSPDPSTSTTSTTSPPDTSSSSESSESGDTVDPDAPEPIIPQPEGECPELVSGMQFIGGLDTMIVAGTPGDTKGPLLLYWHGTGSSPMFELPNLIPTQQGDEILAEGGIIVAPQSNGQDRGGFTPNGVWYEGTDGEGGDLAWADHIVACAVQNHNIDPRRIYTTGCSAGGLMSGGLALKRSNYIAAVATNSGGIIVGGVELLQDPTRIPAVFTMHGGNDDVVLVNFTQTSAALDNAVTEAGGFAVDCNHGGGHCVAPDDLRVAAWEFLEAHTFGRLPSPYESGLPEDFPDYCKIWE